MISSELRDDVYSAYVVTSTNLSAHAEYLARRSIYKLESIVRQLPEVLVFVYVGHSEASDTPKSQTLYLQKQIETCKMAPRYKKGQMVTYKPIGGPDSNTPESVGRINDVLTEPGMQANRNVQASADNPRYEIVNDNTGKTTTVFEANILGRAQ